MNLRHYVMPNDSETACEIVLAKQGGVETTSNAHMVGCEDCRRRLMRSWFGGEG